MLVDEDSEEKSIVMLTPFSQEPASNGQVSLFVSTLY